LRVGLQGPGKNTRGVGARVEVEAGGVIRTQWMLAGGRGFTNGTTFELHFGLGAAETVDALRVYWPDGEVTVHEDVTARQRVTVVRR
jgi:hypothetical protein